jgi:hypothetical protein
MDSWAYVVVSQPAALTCTRSNSNHSARRLWIGCGLAVLAPSVVYSSMYEIDFVECQRPALRDEEKFSRVS